MGCALTGLLHCNVTKIKSLIDIPNALDELAQFLPNAKVEKESVDNITATTSLNTKINLNLLFLRLKQSYNVKYNIQKFPAIFVRYPVGESQVTLFIFSSGKVVCVGAKSEGQLVKASNWLKSYFSVIQNVSP